jgi:hypothetical protein
MKSIFSLLNKRIDKGSEIVSNERAQQKAQYAKNWRDWYELKHTILVKTGMVEYEEFFLAEFELDKKYYETLDHNYVNYATITRMILIIPGLMPIVFRYYDCITKDISLHRAKGDFDLHIHEIINLSEGVGDKLLGYKHIPWMLFSPHFIQSELDAAINKALFFAKEDYEQQSWVRTVKKIRAGQFYARGNCGGDCDPRI